MIAHLTGTVAETGSDHAVIDVGGVGYLVLASARTLSALVPSGGATGETVRVFTDMQVREDSMTLFGFATVGERDWFRLLTGVQGVGGKVALNILSALDADELSRAVASQDKAMVVRANGVGPKLAERIVRELKDKVGVLAGASSFGASGGVGGGVAAGGVAGDALAALAALGFKPGEASAAVNAAQDELGPDATLDVLVRLALKKAAK
jgi:holliday junction DNA helicase RuvA